MQRRPDPIAQRADKIRLPAPVGKKLRIHFLGVKAGHRSAIQPQRTGSDYHVGALHGHVSRDQILRRCLVIFEQRFEIACRI